MTAKTGDIYSIEKSGEQNEKSKLFEDGILVWEGESKKLMTTMRKYQAEHVTLVGFMERHTVNASNMDLVLEVLLQCRFKPIKTVQIFNALIELLQLFPASTSLEQKREFLTGFTYLFGKNKMYSVEKPTIIDINNMFKGV
jgi:hypothetical protein